MPVALVMRPWWLANWGSRMDFPYPGLGNGSGAIYGSLPGRRAKNSERDYRARIRPGHGIPPAFVKLTRIGPEAAQKQAAWVKSRLYVAKQGQNHGGSFQVGQYPAPQRVGRTRSAVFSRLAKEITVAACMGGGDAANPRLRLDGQALPSICPPTTSTGGRKGAPELKA